MRRSLFNEILVTSGFVAGATVLWTGINTITTPPSDVGAMSLEAQGTIGGLCVIGGSALLVLSLLGGLVIAFGIGPSWLASYEAGLTVESRFVMYADGTLDPDGPASNEIGAKCYLRFRTKHGDSLELMCPDDLYSHMKVGQVGRARFLGCRLIAFTPSAI